MDSISRIEKRKEMDTNEEDPFAMETRRRTARFSLLDSKFEVYTSIDVYGMQQNETRGIDPFESGCVDA